MERARALIDRNFYDQPFNAEDLTEFCEITNTVLLWACRKRNPAFPKDPRHLHVMLPGWEAPMEWSWRKAIIIDIGRSPEEAATTRRKQSEDRALRFAIRDDLREYLEARWPTACAVCGCGREEELTVHHARIPFQAIAEEFLAKVGPLRLESRAGCGDLIADIEVEANWIAYHASRATYEVLCRRCNSSIGIRV